MRKGGGLSQQPTRREGDKRSSEKRLPNVDPRRETRIWPAGEGDHERRSPPHKSKRRIISEEGKRATLFVNCISGREE